MVDSKLYFTLLLIGGHFFRGVTCYPTSLFTFDCLSMTPEDSVFQAQTSPAPYSIKTSQSTYKPGDLITVTLEANSGEYFQGFLLQAWEVGKADAVGSFSISDSDHGQLLNCNGEANSALSYSSNSETSVTVAWTAPQASLGDIEFRSTILKNVTTFWVGLNSSPIQTEESRMEKPVLNKENPNPEKRLLRSVRALPALANPITFNNCSHTKSCFEVPINCDPAAGGNCLFFSTSNTSPGASDVAMELQGQSSGYIVSILSTDYNSGTAYICAQNSSGVTFLLALYNGMSLQQIQVGSSVDTITASLSGNVIRCSFIARAVNNGLATSETTKFLIRLGIGDYTSGVLGNPVIKGITNGTANVLSFTSGGSRPGITMAHGLLIGAAWLTWKMLY
ncbi:FRRS1 reductase, partial [Amia calva]|nr:FRRS1 reductase [Amia calva]